tara:strand:- start:854 stop:1117 length:264 start_codon:yes stop_codon:yes gene_type:complete
MIGTHNLITGYKHLRSCEVDAYLSKKTDKIVIPKKRNPKKSLQKLSPKQADEIRTLYSQDGVFQKDLAKKYSVGQSTIFKIINGQSY